MNKRRMQKLAGLLNESKLNEAPRTFNNSNESTKFIMEKVKNLPTPKQAMFFYNILVSRWSDIVNLVITPVKEKVEDNNITNEEQAYRFISERSSGKFIDK